MRKIKFAKGEYYHIFNRGVDKRSVFLDTADYARFIKDMLEFNNDLTREERLRLDNPNKSELSSEKKKRVRKISRLVDIVCYCLNSNHYHLILRQKAEAGVEKYMHKLNTGYTNYFNKRQTRTGSLFQGSFKAVHVDSNEYLLYLSAYVNCNREIHGGRPAEKEKWSSMPEYLGKNKNQICQKGSILGQFRKASEYLKFAKINARKMRDKKEIEKLILEN